MLVSSRFCSPAMPVPLRGRVLPIGGLKEKTMAALRNGVRTVIIPRDNEKDLDEIDQTVRAALQFVLVDHVDQVLAAALTEVLPEVAEKRESVSCLAFESSKVDNAAGLKQ